MNFVALLVIRLAEQNSETTKRELLKCEACERVAKIKLTEAQNELQRAPVTQYADEYAVGIAKCTVDCYLRCT